MLEAGNIEGTKRILGKLLEKDPDNYPATDLMIEALTKQSAHKEALAYCDNWLSRHPNSVGIHVFRFKSLAKLGRTRDMKASLKQFRTTFPHETTAISIMEMFQDAQKGNANSFRKTLEKEFGDVSSPDLIKVKAIALHQVNDLFEADYYLSKAVEFFPNDAELLAAMATNRFQIGRLASARMYAARSLAADPTRRRMAFLSRATWLFYYPGFYLILLGMAAAMLLGARLNKVAAVLIFVILLSLIRSALSLFLFPILILFGLSTSPTISVLIIGAIGVFVLSLSDAYYKMLFGRKKTVKLKKF
ncbi:tetratricopeptide repeat protein [Falsiruegeria litorea]|uniref:tetratricopeptide repeat protein n=1 Tax=Falsiruegeria litorea TaxID=1280831 RepID=UPI0010544D60|nr:hypothetical protein [Falsiruegeria litorea]